MADEHKEIDKDGKIVDTPTEKEVTLTQTKIDELINKGYGRGAEKAKAELAESLGVTDLDKVKELIKAKKDADEASKSDLQKATDNIASLTAKIKGLEVDNNGLKDEMKIERVATENGIAEVDYYKHLRAIASKEDKFVEETFVENLRTTKPYLFGASDKAKLDASPNPKDVVIKDKIKGAKSMAELHALNK